MNSTIKNILVVIAGLFIGSIVNMGVILLGTSIIQLPVGIDPSNVESMKTGMHLFEAKHFISPFLGHALGTLTGAFIAAKLGASNQLMLALIVGAFFLLGGIANVFMLPAPTWFCALDLLFAYIPMAYLGWKLTSIQK